MSQIVVTTEHGTKHFIDTEAKTLIRKPVEGHGWGPDGIGFGPVTPDGEVFAYDNDPEIVIGERVYFENMREWRQTSRVTKILIPSDLTI